MESSQKVIQMSHSQRTIPVIARPHFHAYFQNQAGIFAIDTIELIGGELPAKETRLVAAWTEIHRQELIENWNALQRGRLPFKIEPLR